MSVSSVSRKGKFINKLPAILTGISIVSFGAALIFSAKETPKALKLIDEAKKAKQEEYEDETEELTVIETVQTTWRTYLPALIFAFIGTAAGIASCSMQYQYAGVLLSAGTVAEKAYEECRKLLDKQMTENNVYRQLTAEEVGEEIERVISEKVDKKIINGESAHYPLLECNGEEELFRDIFSGQEFGATVNDIEAAKNELQRRLNYGENQSINDWLELIGCNYMDCGEDIIWDADRCPKIEIAYGSVWVDELGKSIGTVRFKNGCKPRGRILA